VFKIITHIKFKWHITELSPGLSKSNLRAIIFSSGKTEMHMRPISKHGKTRDPSTHNIVLAYI